MVQAIERVDRAVKAEAAAKELLATCQEMDSLLGQLAIMASTPKFLQSGSEANQFDPVTRPIAAKLMVVRYLTQTDSKASAIAADLSRNIEQLIENVRDLAGS